MTAVRALITLGMYQKESRNDGGDTSSSLAFSIFVYLLDLLDNEPSPWFKFKLADILTEPYDILVATAALWEKDPMIDAIMMSLALGTLEITRGVRGPTSLFLELISRPKAVVDAGEFLVKSRFLVFQNDGPIQATLRGRVWCMLNSEATAQDSRLRLAVLRLYTLMGGDKDAVSKLGARPKRPTRPILKKEKLKLEKLKQEKLKMEQAESVPDETKPKSRKRKRDEAGMGTNGSSKRATTDGNADGVVSAVGLTVKVKIPLGY